MAINQSPSTPDGECEQFQRSEMKLALEVGRGPRIDIGWPKTISYRIDQVVIEKPDAVAIKESSGISFTYLQMSNKANAIAALMLDAGVTPGSHVAVFCEPTAHVVTVLLAIMRIGAVYVPLDLRNPIGRLASMVADCQPTLIICYASTIADARGLGSQAEIINLSDLVNPEETSINDRCNAEAGGFVLYTSGSTGTPKGILLKQSGFLNHVVALHRTFGIGMETVLQQSSPGFDASLLQMFLALTGGGTIVIGNKSIRGEYTELAKLMLREKITLTIGAPSEYAALLRYGENYLRHCSSWRFSISGGESITPSLKQQFRHLALPQLLLLNGYGPAEISVGSSYGIVPYSDAGSALDNGEYPIGPTLPNYSVYIVDENLEPVPRRFAGEICIGGAGVGIGYLNKDSLSNAKFLPDRFATADDVANGWTQLYRTGDRGRLLSDGSLAFLGRMDGGSQVKIRGIRIELEDVANVILKTANGVLDEAAVSVRGHPDQIMIAFVVFSLKNPPSEPEQYLKNLRDALPLPSYMCPAALFPLERLPATINGKLDQRAIDEITPSPREVSHLNSQLTVPETLLKRIWETVLSNIPFHVKIDQDSDFFQVGGNSLLLVKLQALIREAFQLAIPLLELSETSVMRDMAARISRPEIDKSQLGAIEWNKEISDSMEDLHRFKSRTKPRTSGSGKTVLLTGSTGFLGQAILRNLVADPRISMVHCVAIRSEHKFGVRASGLDSAKIVSYPGDLSLPLLGLSQADATRLSNEVDIIIHNGAIVSLLKTYQTLRKPNVQSTIEIIKLALPSSIPIHYVSTAGVGRLTGRASLREVSIASHHPPINGSSGYVASDGYVASKWASEQCIELACDRFNLPVWIHRPVSIVGEGVPETDLMHNILKFSCLMKAVPVLDDWQGFFDFVPVDIVAQDIIEAALGQRKRPGDNMERESVLFVHHCSETKVPIRELKRYLEERDGVSYETLTLQKWVLNASQMGLSYMVASVFESLYGAKRRVPKILKG